MKNAPEWTWSLIPIGIFTAMFGILCLVSYLKCKDIAESAICTPISKGSEAPPFTDSFIEGAMSGIRYGQTFNIQKGFYDGCEIEIEEINGKDTVSGTIRCPPTPKDRERPVVLQDKTVKITDIIGEGVVHGK